MHSTVHVICCYKWFPKLHERYVVRIRQLASWAWEGGLLAKLLARLPGANSFRISFGHGSLW